MGSDGDPADLLPLGQAVGRPHEPGDHAHLHPARQGRAARRRWPTWSRSSRADSAACSSPGWRWAAGWPIPSVDYAATLPGPWGAPVAFVAEAAISCLLVLVVLAVSNHPRRARVHRLCAGLLVAIYITVEAPLSGMSMNPARTLRLRVLRRRLDRPLDLLHRPAAGHAGRGPALPGAPRPAGVACAKLHHQNSKRCIFCEYQAARVTAPAPREPIRTPRHYSPHREGSHSVRPLVKEIEDETA